MASTPLDRACTNAAPPAPRAFPELRRSRCAGQSFAEELRRLHAMSIEERVVEALGMDQRFAWLAPARKDR